MGLYLGLDIGVASVGYGVITSEGHPVDAGVRMFSEGSKKDNETRRTHRHMRRGIRRKHHRLERADRLFVKQGLAQFIDGTYELDLRCDANVTPYHLRVKGLRAPLSDKELVIALRHILKRRGSQPLNAIDEKAEKSAGGDSLSTKAILARTQGELACGKYICEIQLERLSSENGSVRGVENRFLTSDYVNEAKQILHTQKAFNGLVDDSFIEAYISLLESRRTYYDGPDPSSPYGWKNSEEWMERLTGNCVYTGQTRIVKHAPSAEFFNLLNDLNNMLIDGEHISCNEKELLIRELFVKQATSPSVSSVLKKLGRAKNAVITGLRVNKSGKQIFSTLPGYRFLRNANDETGSNVDMTDFKLLDEIAKILTVYQTAPDAATKLAELQLSDSYIERLVSAYDDNELCDTFKGTHSLSREAIWLVLEDMWVTDKNQMQLFSEKNIVPQHSKLFIKKGRIMPEIVSRMAVSAVARRAISQAFAVFNDLLDKYPCGFERITVEMAREKNSDDRKKWLDKVQKDNESINNTVREILEGKHGDRLFEKVRLWHLQNGIDLYTGEPISIDDLRCAPDAFEIDHIIPISISFDNSRTNLVLTTRSNNQNKGQRTPYQWMQDVEAPDYNAFAARILKINDKQQMPDKKRNNLLFKEDITKWEVRQKFINRNLVDTRYACKEVVLALKTCLKDSHTVVHTVNGSFTHYLRKRWGITKDRDIDFSHHAVDALVIAASSLVTRSLSTFQNYELFASENVSFVVDKNTGEVVNDLDREFKSTIDYFHSFSREILSFDKIKYSHKIDKKQNRQLCNETLYSTRIIQTDDRTVEKKTAKIGDLYATPTTNSSKTQLLKLLYRLFVAKPEDCLMYESDRLSYNKLKAVYDKYIGDGKENPFALYKKEHGFVTKNSKKGTGPAVKSLRYYDGEVLGNPLDLSHKYGCKGNKRVIMDGLSTLRIDVYKSVKKGYKVIRISPSMMRNGQPFGKQFEIEKVKQGIAPEDTFMFSLYKNDMFVLDGQLYRFIGYQGGNRVEVSLVDRLNLDADGKKIRLTPRIGSNTKEVKFISSNSLGVLC